MSLKTLKGKGKKIGAIREKKIKQEIDIKWTHKK